MTTPIKRFFKALDIEERKFASRLSEDNFGIYFRSAINELDWYYYNSKSAKELSIEQQEQFYIILLGVTRFIYLAFKARSSFDAPVVMFPRKKELTLDVLSVVSAIGMIQHGRRIAQTIQLGIGKIEEVSDNEFMIKLPDELVDESYFEREVLEHYVNESRRMFSLITSNDKFEEIKEDVSKKLSELVYPFAKDYIGYDADILLDEYFMAIAYHEISLKEGYDTFHYKVKFGGVCFQNYILALTFIYANAIRHEKFAEALVDKDKNIRLENVLTVSADTESFVQNVMDAVNHFGVSLADHEALDYESARKIFEVLSCSRRNAKLVEAPGSPLPPIVQCSDTGCIKYLTGAQYEPIRFLLESLRYHYPKDYDINQATREKSMQRAIRRVLGETFKNLEYRENIKIRLNSNILTDIDFVVLEEKTGTVILCQLKHQELYGYNIHSKRMRTDRLKRQIQEWLSDLDIWLKSVDDVSIRQSLRIPRSYPKLKYHQLIITRHFAYPLKDLVQDVSVVFTSWTNFINSNEIIKKQSHDSISELLMLMREQQVRQSEVNHLLEPTTKWKINNLTFVTTHAGSVKADNGKETI